MIRPLPPFAVAALLLLAACGGEAAREEAAAAPAAGGYVARVRALPEGQRHGVLFRAIRDAGRACQGVTASQEAGAPGAPAAWLATCDDAQWVVTLADDGTATVTDARAVATSRQ